VARFRNGSDALRRPILTAFVARLVLVWSMNRNHRPMVSPAASGMLMLPGMSTITLLPTRDAFTAEIQDGSYGFAAGASVEQALSTHAVPFGRLPLLVKNCPAVGTAVVPDWSRPLLK